MKAIDPICKMEVDTNTKLTKDYKGKTYYFCSTGCLKEFIKTPEKFLKEAVSR